MRAQRKGMSAAVLAGTFAVTAIVAGTLSFFAGQTGSGAIVTVTGATTFASTTVVSTANISTTRTIFSTSTVGSLTSTVTTTVTSTAIATSMCPGCVNDGDGDGV